MTPEEQDKLIQAAIKTEEHFQNQCLLLLNEIWSRLKVIGFMLAIGIGFIAGIWYMILKHTTSINYDTLLK